MGEAMLLEFSPSSIPLPTQWGGFIFPFKLGS